MLIVIALGGNALLQRGEPLEASLQKANVKITGRAIAELAKEHQVVICHGNGPQVGLLALQNDAYKAVKPYPLDVLDAESQGMIGYLIQQEVGNNLPEKPVVTLLTQIEVDKKDAAFGDPSKPIGPVYNTKEEAEKVGKERGWDMAPDGKYFRRVVPSPQPQEIVELPLARQLLDQGTTVIFGGGGGIPVVRQNDGTLEGVEAVIDKDNTASLIAEKLGADMLIILSDVDAVYTDWGTADQKSIMTASPDILRKMDFARGSMGPKIHASCRFVENTNKTAAIGKLSDVLSIVDGDAGTSIQAAADGITYY
jgi:carbamate kinase